MPTSFLEGEMVKVKGGCLCGSSRYESDSDPIVSAVCHCKDCQKHSGSVFGLYVGIPKNGLKTSGQGFKTFEGSGGSGSYFHRIFCSNCGSSLYAAIELAPDLYFIHAGTLDDATWVKPEMQAWATKQLPCATLTGEVATFDGNLPSG